MIRKTKILLLLFAGLFPASSLKSFVFRCLGHQVHASARIGVGLYFNIRKIHLGKYSKIANFNIIRGLQLFSLDDSALIGSFNWFTCSETLCKSGAPGELRLGSNSAITSRHYVDATGGISIGSFTTIAGVRSIFFTHGIDYKINSQVWKPIVIGDYCLLNSNLSVAPGALVSNRNVIGMGSILIGSVPGSENLITGDKARVIRHLDASLYFTRDVGPVS